MCEFYLNGKCFHKDLIEKNKVATECKIHGCEKCTNFEWQKEILEKELSVLSTLGIQELEIKENTLNSISAIGTIFLN